MALRLPGTSCSICGNVLANDSDVVATTHFIDDDSDPLWQFSDSCMHRACFLSWKHKDEFRRKYNESIGMIVWENGTRHHMEPDGSISFLRASSSDDRSAS